MGAIQENMQVDNGAYKVKLRVNFINLGYVLQACFNNVSDNFWNGHKGPLNCCSKCGGMSM